MHARRGLVVDGTGAPVAGAAVAFCDRSEFPDPEAMLATATIWSDAEGCYAIGIPDGAQGCVAVVFPGRQVWTTYARGFPGVEAHPLPPAILLPGAVLTGRVRDGTGDAIEGATVRVRSSIPSTGAALQAQARTGDDGLFRLPGVAPSGLRVEVRAPGFRGHELLADQQTPIDVLLRRADGFVRGVVLDEAGAAVAGARIGIRVPVRLPSDSSVVSGADGTFELPVPECAVFRVFASSEADGRTRYPGPLLAGPTDGVELRPGTRARPSLARVRIKVVDAETQRPLGEFRASAGAAQFAADAQRAYLYHLQRRRAFEGSEAELEVTSSDRYPGGTVVVVDAPGHGHAIVRLDAPGDEAVVIALGEEAIIEGTVVDEGSGAPIAGAVLRAAPKGEGSGMAWDPRPADFASDAQGRFEIRGLRAGDYHVQAWVRGRSISMPALVTAKPTGGQECRLAIPAMHRLRFRVGDACAKGLPMRLTLRRAAGLRREPVPGHYDFFEPQVLPENVPLTPGELVLDELPPGTYQCILEVPSRTQLGASRSILVGPFETNGGVHDLALPPVGLVVSGQVVLPDGLPVARVAVLAHEASASPSPAYRRVAPCGLVGDGRFELDLMPGRYAFQLADVATGIVFHTEDEDVDLTEPRARVVIRPECRWLDVACHVRGAGPDVRADVYSIAVELDAARWDSSSRDLSRSLPPFMGIAAGNAVARHRNTVNWTPITRRDRWLVPAGRMQLQPMQMFHTLRAGGSAYRPGALEPVSVTVDAEEQSVTLDVAPAPSLQELDRSDADGRG